MPYSFECLEPVSSISPYIFWTTGAPMGYEYAFNAQSVFTIISTYIQATNDTTLLGEVLAGGYTVDEVREPIIQLVLLVEMCADKKVPFSFSCLFSLCPISNVAIRGSSSGLYSSSSQ